MYLYELPTTAEVVFGDFLLASSAQLVTQLSQATELRARVRALLKANRADDATTHSSRDWLAIVKATQEYLPHLLAIYNCLQTDDILLKYGPEFAWRTTFSAPPLLGPPPRIAIRGIHYELLAILLLSGTALSNLASSIIAALGPAYERDRTLSDADRKAKDDRLKLAADLLCRAAGIFDYLASSFIPAWENAVGRIDPRPPETTPELANALSNLALADAQSIAIRKLLSPSVALAEDTLTPGPPLPKSHPSASLLAKLHLEACARYEAAEQLARLSSSKRAGTSSAGGGGGGSGGGGAGGGIALGASASGRVGGSGGAHAVEPSPAIVAARQSGVAYELHQVPPRGGGLGAYDGSDDGSSSNGGLGANQQQQQKGSKPSRLLHFASRLGGGDKGSGGTKTNPARPGSSDRPPPGSASGGQTTYSHPGITPALLSYLSTHALFARAQAYRWLGIDSGEARSAYGEALAYLHLARDELEEGGVGESSGKDGSSGTGGGGSGKSKLARKLADLSLSAPTSSTGTSSLAPTSSSTKHRTRLRLESAAIAHWTRAYTKLNDGITFLPVPSRGEVLGKVPAGRRAVEVKAFVLPRPAFGPGSQAQGQGQGQGSGGSGVAGVGGGDGPAMRRMGFGYAEALLPGEGGDGAEAGAGSVGSMMGALEQALEDDPLPPPPLAGTLLGTERRSGAGAPGEEGGYAGAGAYY